MTHKEKVAIITGGTRGLGKVIAEELARDGYTVILNFYSDVAEAVRTGKEFLQKGYKFELAKIDVRNEEKVEDMVKHIVSKYGRIDVLVNNAGVNRDAVVWKMDKKDWDEVVETNLTGTFLCTKHVIPQMRKQGYGRIVNISSVVGEVGGFGVSNYAASKAGIIGFTKAVAKEVALFNITVNCVAPGYLETGMSTRIKKEILEEIKKRIPLGRLGKAREVASVVKFLCSEEASYITGAVIGVNGGYF